MLENVKLITDLQDYNPTPEVIDNWGIIASEFMKVDELSKALEDEYPEGITPEQLTDLLANDFDKVLGMVGLTWDEIEATPSGWNKQENYKENKKMAKELKEGLKVIAELGDYKPWSGAVDTWDKIEEAGKLDELESMLEDMYPEGIGMTELNDLLWFEPETVFEWLGLEEEDSDEDDDYEESLNEVEKDLNPSDLYDEATKVLKPEDIAHHESDLYLRKTPEAEALIKRLNNDAMLSTFKSNIDGDTWYDLPFCYKPFWVNISKKGNAEESLDEISDDVVNKVSAARQANHARASKNFTRVRNKAWRDTEGMNPADRKDAIIAKTDKVQDKLDQANLKLANNNFLNKLRDKRQAAKPESLATNEATTNTKEINKRCQEHMLSYYDSKEDLIAEIKHYMADVKNRPINAWEAGKTMVEYGAFAVYYNQVRDALMEILGQTEEEVDKFSDQKQWEFYQNLIGRNASNLISGRIYI